MKTRTCVSPEGRFVYGVHKPSFSADNFRESDSIGPLGRFSDGLVRENLVNFPPGIVDEPSADTIYEIPNPLPFRGTTYIAESWAEQKAGKPERIGLPKPQGMSFSTILDDWFAQGTETLSSARKKELLESLPEPILVTIATQSTDTEDLTILANICCEFVFESDRTTPAGLLYQIDPTGGARPKIRFRDVFEVLVNNPRLPYAYKLAMVLRPGVQGASEIVGEFEEGRTHVFEYLRRNSYIPWGHYAANMAHDSVRYRLSDLSMQDMEGLRHLYYQRTYARLARILEIPVPEKRMRLPKERLEQIRREIVKRSEKSRRTLEGSFDCTLWGWNFGFDFSASKYRLHASHQQIHQQFAMVPSSVESQETNTSFQSFACGDMVAKFIREYREETGKSFFESYLRAIENNRRMDGLDGESDLAVWRDENAMLFVPKAQTSQWELQIVTLSEVGNIVEADTRMRNSLDRAMLLAMRTLCNMGAQMVTVIEYAKRISERNSDQRLLYAFLPKIPYSMGAFSEAQLRWINGHFPEDFASACRANMPDID